uniref:Uncharacterized protein n=1 Tax=Compsopogon caeruleus TaxID=31354 RepID=A0A7S1T5Q3_9RHOD|mmetsp:Transcript_11211/g.22329  ORF Transcript_11211/g.22329 Transcript_11211/m.22329 type:complete len:143 (+) Transcript_11211:469-897(+)
MSMEDWNRLLNILWPWYFRTWKCPVSRNRDNGSETWTISVHNFQLTYEEGRAVEGLGNAMKKIRRGYAIRQLFKFSDFRGHGTIVRLSPRVDGTGGGAKLFLRYSRRVAYSSLHFRNPMHSPRDSISNATRSPSYSYLTRPA